MSQLTDERLEDIVREVCLWIEDSPPENRNIFLSMSKRQLIEYHFTLGRMIRNEFGLWRECGFDTDEESMRVIEAVWERKRKEAKSEA